MKLYANSSKEYETPSAEGFGIMVVLSVQAIAWFAIGLAAGYGLWH